MTADQNRIKELEKENASLRAIVEDLLERVNKLQNRKNSNNSSIPPSKDENRPRKTKSLRRSSGKKPGGQKGHKGSTLHMTNNPDIIIEHRPKQCSNCGSTLQDANMFITGKRQVIDIPVIGAQYSEHRVFSTMCSCGVVSCGDFPENVKAPISYGSNTEALIAYMYSRQYLPSERMQELLGDVYGLPISEGSIYNILGRFVQKSGSAYEAIREKIEQSKVIGADETGIRIDGKMNWGWVWQNKEATFISISANRGPQTITDNFEKGLPQAILVNDCWKPHFKSSAVGHQLCIAHLLRELKYFEERFNHHWPTSFRDMLLASLTLKKKLQRYQYFYPVKERGCIEEKFQSLLKEELPPGMKDVETFQNRMCRYKEYLFTFLYHPEVPPDNNASERAIRNIKVKQKISGQFKSELGAKCFAVIRSITDTCLKNNQNVLYALKLIAKS